MRIATFIAFLACYGLYFWGAAKSSQKLQRDALEGKWFVSNQLLILMTYSTFFACVYFVSGFWSLPLVVIFVSGAEIGMVISAICRSVVAAPKDKSLPRTIWAGGEFGLAHNSMVIAAMVVVFLALLGYPVLSGMARFSHTISPRQLTLTIFRYSLIAFVFSAYPLQVIASFGVFVSENVDQQSRKLYLAGQLSSLISTSLFLTLAFWAFGLGHARYGVPVGGVQLTFSPALVMLLVVFFLVTALIPYWIGTVRAANWRQFLAEKKRGYVATFRDILNEPMGQLYLARLTALQADLQKERSDLVKQDSMVEWLGSISSGKVSKDDVPQTVKPVVEGYLRSRELDPRFAYLDDLGKYVTEVQNVLDDLGQRDTPTSKRYAARGWANVYNIRVAEFDKELESAKPGKTGISVAVGFILTSVGGGILGELGKWAWSIVSKSLPQ